MRVLITGASSGIGQALALAYLQQGAFVYACGRCDEKLTNALPKKHEQLTRLVFDVNDLTSIKDALQNHDAFDLVILNAGVCEYIDDALRFDSSCFARVVQANLIGVAHCLEVLLPKMRKGSQLGIMSSTVTLLPLSRAEAYGASKAGLDYLACVLAVDLAQHDISVSLIQPGFVDTPLTQKNTFPMPGIISSDKACAYIMRGLQKRQHTIRFPRRFVWVMMALAILPFSLWRRLATNMVRTNS